MPLRPIAAAELPIQTQALAEALVGCILVRDSAEGRTAGRIVETEAYLRDDPASHSFIGERPRNRAMFGAPLHAYVYRIYGTHFCFNVASEAEGHGAAVLIRALEPTHGLELMRMRRGLETLRDLCRGPGRLCQAMAIDRELDATPLLKTGPLWLARPEQPASTVGLSVRIGLSKAQEAELRYYERGSPFLSGPRSLSP